MSSPPKDGASTDATDAGFGSRQSKPPQPPWPQAPPPSALDDVALEYRMSHPNRGYCLIFNQVNFDRTTGQPTRDGSDVDAAALEVTFSRLAFDVRSFRDLSSAHLVDVLREFKAKDHSSNDCIVLVVLSHGYDGHFYARDRQLPIEWVAKQFRPDACPTLAGKPKLFFIQACRGDSFDAGHEVADSGDDLLDALPGSGGGGASAAMRVPLESDFYFFYSTPPGYFSWRNSQRGSWFVQQLTSVVDRHGDKLELQQLMLLVQRLVATNFASDTGEFASTGMKQMPITVSHLRKLLYFRPKQRS